MATLLVYPDAADLSVIEHNDISELTFACYLDAHVKNWDKNSEGESMSVPRFAATINGSAFPPTNWFTRPLMKDDVIEVVIPPKGLTIAGWIMVVVSVASAVYSYYMMSQLNTDSSTVPDSSNIYDVNVQANSAELMGVRPEWFGYHKTVPSYLCSPFKYYNSDGENCICVMLHVGEGYYQISDSGITLASTPVTTLGDDVDYQIFEPGDNVSGHEAHKNIYTADEVGGTDSATGLDFVGPSSEVTINDENDYAISLGDGTNTIAFMDNGFRKNVGWDNGTTFTLVGAYIDGTSNVILNTAIEIIESGSDEETTKALPDVISGTGFSVMTVGKKIQLAGAGSDNDGTYLIRTVSNTEITLSDLSGNAVTWLSAIANVNVIFFSSNGNEGLYKVLKTDSNKRLVVSKVGDSSWSGFTGKTYTSGVTLTVTSEDIEYVLGPYVACPEGHTTKYLEIDMLRSNGWGRYDDKGDLHDISVSWSIWVRDADLGENDTWRTYNYTYSGQSYDQVGKTHKIYLPSAIRPEVMLVRNTASYDDSKYLDELQWMRLKCKLDTVSRYASSTTLALTIKADSSLSSAAMNKVKVLLKRKLPVPDGNGGWTSDLHATRDIAPVVRYLVLSSGGSDDDLASDELLALHKTWSDRKEYFDGGFVDETTIYDAMKTVLQAGMAEFCFDLGEILPKRLKRKTSAGHVYTPDIMTGKGLTVSTTLYDPNENEGLIVYYMDPTDWTTNSVKCWLGNKSTIIRWGELELTTGVTSKTRAWRIGMRALRRAKMEKVKYSFTTEMDALNSNYLDYAEIADDLPNFTQFGEITDWQNVVNGDGDAVVQLTVDRELIWTDGETHYMTVRRHDGTGNGPFTATFISNDVVQLDGLLDFVPDLTGKIDPPLWMFGDAETYSEPAIISSVQPSIDDEKTSCSVMASNYSAEIFTDDDNDPPGDNITWWE